jgi:hypothetical protein
MRTERAAGLLAALFVNSKSKNGGFKVWDFTPHEDEPPISIDEAKEKWH